METEMNNETLFATYTTQTQADTFVRIFTQVNGKGHMARSVRVDAGIYQVFILACPQNAGEWLFGKRLAA
jgi:hypothetical protein